jgi:hypothetical protein
MIFLQQCHVDPPPSAATYTSMTTLPPTSTERTRDIVHQIAKQCDVAPEMLEDAYPCSPFQAGLFDASMQAADVLHYNFVFKLEDTTPEVVDQICKVFESVHFRNPVLRSRIVQYTDRNDATTRVAQVHVKEDLEWLKFDDLDQYCHERTGHCLRHGERIIQYGVSRDRKYLVWTMHHSLYDGWSIGLLWKELCDTMSAEDDQPTLTQRPKFVKFIAHLQKPMAEVDRQYWIKHLASFTGPRLKQYKLVPKTDTHRNGSLKLVDVRESSINTTTRIQAAWFCTLVELYRNLDTMTLLAATGRNIDAEGIADMSGPCLCIVPFRQRVNLLATLYQFMSNVQEGLGELLAHEHAGMESLEALVEEGQRPTHAFNLKSGPGGDFTGFRGLEYQPRQSSKKNKDWVFAVSVGEEAIRWDLFYDTDRLGQDAVKLISERFPVLLDVCQKLESHENVILRDVIDVQRLSCDL